VHLGDSLNKVGLYIPDSQFLITRAISKSLAKSTRSPQNIKKKTCLIVPRVKAAASCSTSWPRGSINYPSRNALEEPSPIKLVKTCLQLAYLLTVWLPNGMACAQPGPCHQIIIITLSHNPSSVSLGIQLKGTGYGTPELFKSLLNTTQTLGVRPP
jgi:hypothetical protein